jgi:hypothetical protein
MRNMQNRMMIDSNGFYIGTVFALLFVFQKEILKEVANGGVYHET